MCMLKVDSVNIISDHFNVSIILEYYREQVSNSHPGLGEDTQSSTLITHREIHVKVEYRAFKG